MKQTKVGHWRFFFFIFFISYKETTSRALTWEFLPELDHVLIHTHTHTHTHTSENFCLYIRSYIYIYTHIHTHTHTQALKFSASPYSRPAQTGVLHAIFGGHLRSQVRCVCVFFSFACHLWRAPKESSPVCVCVCVCVYTCDMCIHIIYIYLWIYVHFVSQLTLLTTCIYITMCIHIHTHTHIYIYIYILSLNLLYLLYLDTGATRANSTQTHLMPS